MIPPPAAHSRLVVQSSVATVVLDDQPHWNTIDLPRAEDGFAEANPRQVGG